MHTLSGTSKLQRLCIQAAEVAQAQDTHYDLQQRVERYDKEKAELQAKLSAAASDAANLEKQRRVRPPIELATTIALTCW